MNTKPAARKTHRKTRTGCRTCKSRKIKCDEQKPACHNCIKHCVQCDFLTIQSIASGPGRLTDTASDSPQASGSILNFNSDPRNTLSAQNNVPLQGLNLTDLELLHNYVTSTAFTLHSDPTMKTIWRINVAQVGFSYDFVMRGMLALSALHLARHRPEKKELYLRQAMLQHQAGLRETTNLLRSMTPDNATAIYIFSAHTLYFTLASPRKSGDFLLVGENGIADWLFLVKGTSFIVETFHETLINGPVGPIFLAGMRRTATREQYLAEEPEAGDPLDELSSLITQASSSISPAHTQIYVKAIDDLRKSFVFCYKQGPSGYETTDIFHWVFRVGNDYLELMRQQTQESLAVFAYFCVVLKRLDNHWWMEGWATHLIAKIWNLLDEEHRLWIRWPVEEIGWIP